MSERDDGLTLAEGIVADALVEASAAFGALPVQHPDEERDFVNAIHRCQDMLAIRIARRAFPLGWPTHTTPAPADGEEGLTAAEVDRQIVWPWERGR